MFKQLRMARPIAIGLIGVLLAPVVPAAAQGVKMCTIHNPHATELSGLAVTGSGYVAVNDSNRRGDRMRIFYFNRDCQLTHSVGYPSSPLDPEDLAVNRNGTLWVADIGDNSAVHSRHGRRHRTIALWRFPVHGSPGVYRMAYPDGRHNAEALILDGDVRRSS